MKLQEDTVMKKFILPFLLIVLIIGCAALIPAEKPEPSNVQYVDGVVQKVEGNSVTLLLKLPEFKKTGETAVAEIAQQVIQKGLFITGIDVDIDGIKGAVGRVFGTTVNIIFDKPQSFVMGAIVKVKIPTKKIAIADFTVIRGGIKEAGSMVMEGLSTALIESGHFTVVERSKLQTILEELKLSQSGLSEEIPEKTRPRLSIPTQAATRI